MWLIPTFPAVPRDGQGADESAKVQGQPVCRMRLLSILFWVEWADFYIQEPSQGWMLQRECAVRVTEEWIPVWPEKAINKPLEMVGEKINAILYMQNRLWENHVCSRSTQCSGYTEERTPGLLRLRSSDSQAHTFTCIILIKSLQNPNSKHSPFSHLSSTNHHSHCWRCK